MSFLGFLVKFFIALVIIAVLLGVYWAWKNIQPVVIGILVFAAALAFYETVFKKGRL